MGEQVKTMTLKDALEGQEYLVQAIDTDDEELNAFLFSLGCYEGEPITVIAHLKGVVWFPSRTAGTIWTTSWRRRSGSEIACPAPAGKMCVTVRSG